MRAIWSDAPPAPAATTISTDFVGSHAAAGASVVSKAAAVPAMSRAVSLIPFPLRLNAGFVEGHPLANSSCRITRFRAAAQARLDFSQRFEDPIRRDRHHRDRLGTKRAQRVVDGVHHGCG